MLFSLSMKLAAAEIVLPSTRNECLVYLSDVASTIVLHEKRITRAAYTCTYMLHAMSYAMVKCRQFILHAYSCEMYAAAIHTCCQINLHLLTTRQCTRLVHNLNQQQLDKPKSYITRV